MFVKIVESMATQAVMYFGQAEVLSCMVLLIAATIAAVILSKFIVKQFESSTEEYSNKSGKLSVIHLTISMVFTLLCVAVVFLSKSILAVLLCIIPYYVYNEIVEMGLENISFVTEE